jgi:tetratricopeptide (TPR) repeat protein
VASPKAATPSQPEENGSAAVNKIFLPFGDGAGIGAFWSGNDFIIVSDRATQMDTSALQGTGVFSAATVQTIGNTTVVAFHFNQVIPLQIQKQPGGWILAVRGENEARRHAVITPEMKDGGLLYPMPQSGRVIELADPSSGARLLVATSVEECPGPLLRRHKLGYEIWPSMQGLVFAIESDQIEVRKGNGGAFLDVLGKGDIPVASGAEGAVADDRVDWSWLGLRALNQTVLKEDYRRRWTQAAVQSPEDRGEARLAAARTAFAMGDAREARAILGTAIEDNPELALQPNVTFLQAASNLMAGNTDAASALANPEAGADGVLWRGLYMARSGANPAKAATLMAQGFSNLQSYPDPLKKQIQPEVATFIARYGSDEDRTALEPLPDDGRFDLARAFMTQKAGDQDKALAMFSHLASDRKPEVSVVAAEQVLGAKLAAGQIRPEEAVSGYEKLLFSARQAGVEKEVRHNLIAALTQAAEWPRVLVAVDDDLRLFPEDRIALAPQVEQILEHLAESDAQTGGAKSVELIDAVAMIESHIDQIPDGPAKGRILAGLGRKLQGLGLPGKAAIAFERALPLASDDAQRSALGAELAQADIDAQRLGQARRALDETQDSGADATLASRRRVITAGLLAREGSRDQALQLLAQDESDASLDLRGRILEEQRNWSEAALVVGRLATKNLPEIGTLTSEQQQLAIRLATDAARANDWSTLDRLREWVGGRRMSPERQRIFTLLVTSPEDELRKRSQVQ